MDAMRIILITGISGSGKSIGLKALEDAGYFCVDNLPPALLRQLVTTRQEEGGDSLAVSMDARSAKSLVSLPEDLTWLRNQGHDVKVLFLTAKTEALIARFSETRRSHPLSHRAAITDEADERRTLTECILAERDMLAGIEEISHVIDTSGMRANKLRAWIKNLVESDQSPLTILFESFAFKFGVPLDADLVFDVRCLPNPYYDPALRPLTGRDAPVAAYLASFEAVGQMIEDISGFIHKWLPRYAQDTRSYLTVGIGCTGGQHRSVYIVEQLKERFSDHAPLLVRHRRQLPEEHA